VCDAMALVACHRCMFHHRLISSPPCSTAIFLPQTTLFPCCSRVSPCAIHESYSARVPRNCGEWRLPRYDLRNLLPNDVFTRQLVAGSFPTNFNALTKLTSLHLEDTALGALPNTLQSLTSLTLVRNVQLGSSLPPSIGGGALQSL
jgi:hypothetical protein